MLGIADLHTPEAVSAAEAAISGNQPAIPLPSSSSETEVEDSSDDSDGSDDDDNEDSEADDDNEDDKTSFSLNLKRSRTIKNDSTQKKHCKTGPKIVELS